MITWSVEVAPVAEGDLAVKMTVQPVPHYYRIEVMDLAHGIKRWARQVGYVSRDLERLKLEAKYFRSTARYRGQTRGNEYRIVKCQSNGQIVEVVDE